MAASLPKSEFRRVYMKMLTRELEAVLRLSPQEARDAASVMVAYLRHKILNGEPVNLGFLSIVPIPVKPREYRYNLPNPHKGRFFQGESTKWVLRIHKSWLKKNRPHWSRF